ncbi:MAG: hypothetical protein J6Z08_02015 [Elusimicrobiales bacterium]|nr:hypothetical protein [Elusimicrobiales bacterium]
MKKMLVLFAGMACLAACCQCPSDTPEVAKAKQVANDFKALLHQQELFIAKNKSCSAEIDKLDKNIAKKYEGNIAIDRTCNMLIKQENLLLRAKADPVNGYTLYSCGPAGLFLTAEGFARNCGNIDMPPLPHARPAQAPKAPVKK